MACILLAMFRSRDWGCVADFMANNAVAFGGIGMSGTAILSRKEDELERTTL
jgi:hypothetical protein